MDSPRPEYTAELLRHFADLRDGVHGGARSRRDKERLFTAAVELLDPHARQALVLQPDFVIIGVEGVGGSGIRGRGLGVVDASVTRRAAC